MALFRIKSPKIIFKSITLFFYLKSELIEFWKLSYKIYLIVIFPSFLFMILIIFLKEPIVFIPFFIYYLSLIPLSILYKKYSDKKQSKEIIELRDLEEKVWRKNLRK